MQSVANGFAVSNIERQRKYILHAAKCRGLRCDALRGLKIAVGYRNVRSALRRLPCDFASDPAAPANDDKDLTTELFRRRLSAQFRFLEGPIFDAKRFRRRQRDIFVFHGKRRVWSGCSRLRHFCR